MVALLMLSTVWGSGATGKVTMLDEDRDIAGHWAEDVLSDWIHKGWINGYPDGSYRPDEPVTRAEMAALIARHLDIPSDVNEIPFHDVDPHAWYAPGIGKLVALDAVAGYEDGSCRPDDLMTRQEAAVLMAGITGLTGDGIGVSDLFMDSLPGWSQQSIQAVQSFGWMVGNTTGTFRPHAHITRAESVTALDNMFRQFSLQRGVVLDQAGNYGPAQGRVGIDQDVELKASGIHLHQVDVFGQLTVGEGVGDGDAELTNIRVEGKTFIHGGGENSIYLNDTDLAETVIARETGKVRVVASDETTIQQLDMNTPTLFELASGEIGLLVIGEGSAGTVVTLAKDTVIRKLIVYDAPVAFRGAGTIEEAEIYAKPVTFEHPPLSMSCDVEVSFICSKTDSDDRDGSDNGDETDYGDDSAEPNQPTMTELVYNPQSVVFEGLGSVESIGLQALWSNHSQSDVTTIASWTSEDVSVASVLDGVVTSVGYGDTNVRAQYRGRTVLVPVSVVPTVTSLVYDPVSLHFDDTGESSWIELTAMLSDGTELHMTDEAAWSSEDEHVASVDGGEVTSQGFGMTMVRAEYAGHTVEVPVEVESIATGLTHEPDDLSFGASWAPQQITLEANFSDGSTSAVTDAATWTSGNTSIVTVNDSGMVSPVGVGDTVISAVYGGQTVDVPVEVRVLLTGLTSSEGESLEFDGASGPTTIQLKAHYSDGSEPNVTSDASWSSGDVSVATVNSSGTVTPIGHGDTVITVSYEDREIEISVSVKVAFTEGVGTEDEPYEITTAEQVSGLRFYTGERSKDIYFELTGNIDLNDADFIDETEGWVPIGTDAEPFLGTLDGNGHVIENLRIDRPGQTHQGLFGYLEGTVANLHLTSVDITGKAMVGALAGELFRGKVDGATASGSIITEQDYSGGSNAGGLIGYAAISEIVDSGADVIVTGVDHNIGGLVGRALNTSIVTSYSHGSVIGNHPDAINLGGLVGYMSGSSKIQDGYATGNVTGNFRVGGLVGILDVPSSDPVITNAYASGTVDTDDSDSSGGLVGDLDAGTITDSFYTDTKFNEGTGKGTDIGTSQLEDESTFTNEGWDFNDIWFMDGVAGRPALQWETE